MLQASTCWFSSRLRRPQLSAVVLHSAALPLQSCCDHVDRTRVTPCQRLVCPWARDTPHNWTSSLAYLSSISSSQVARRCPVAEVQTHSARLTSSNRSFSSRHLRRRLSSAIRIFSCVRNSRILSSSRERRFPFGHKVIVRRTTHICLGTIRSHVHPRVPWFQCGGNPCF